MEALQETVNGLAMQLVNLAVLILVFMGITAIILRFIPIFQEIKNFILGLSSLAATYFWFQITFM
ncbi:hypothetical protein [Virgibacillus sediminis]|uniref:Uncharacterized protein n=1 Tax=Virgibacillus sediminis TaxID=202260 RepID=A0ABV7A679_9BACI